MTSSGEDKETPLFRVVGIDVGYSNLALVVCDVDTVTYEIHPVFAHMCDLRDVVCDDCDCMFEKRDRKAAHLVSHYINTMDEWLRGSDKVLIEAQPQISCFKDVEQLILLYTKQRFSNGVKDHVVLLHPNTLHAHFGMTRCDKVKRRLEIVEITRRYLEELELFHKLEVQDHLADACGYIMLYVQTLMPEAMAKLKPNPFDKFKFGS